MFFFCYNNDMTLKREVPTDYFEDWPKHYYEIKDISLREKALKTMIEKNGNLDDQIRLEILQKRFQKENHYADLFMLGWLNCKTLTTEKIHFLNRNRIQKELQKNLSYLCILNQERNSFLHEEWKTFSKEWILSCIGSHSYKQIAVGIGHVSDKNVAMRIANDIECITKKLPAQFQLEESCKEFREIMIQTYQEMLENGEEYWKLYCNNFK